MTDTYRTPDNPLTRALEQARAALAQQRAEQAARNAANIAAVDDLRGLLAELDPPLAVDLRPEKASYEGDNPPEWVVIVAPTDGHGYRACRLWNAATALPDEVRTTGFAEQIERLCALERAALARDYEAGLAASAAGPAVRSETQPRLSTDEWHALWGVGCAVGAWLPALLTILATTGARVGLASGCAGMLALLAGVFGYIFAPNQRAWERWWLERKIARGEARVARMRQALRP